MAHQIKREHGRHPRINQGRASDGGGNGGSNRGSEQPQGRNGNTENQPTKYPDWVYMADTDIQHYFQCTAEELRILKAHLLDYMERNDYDNHPYPTTWAEDTTQRHFRALWARMVQHSNDFRDMLTGARWDDDEKPHNLATKLEECKKRLGLSWKSAAAKRRKSEERKRAENDKEERREARRERKKRARMANRAREQAADDNDADDEAHAYPDYARSSPRPAKDEPRVYPSYTRHSTSPTHLEEGICPDYARFGTTPATMGGFFSARPSISPSRTSSSNPWTPRNIVDLDEIEEVPSPSTGRRGEVMDLDEIENEDIKPSFEKLRITQACEGVIDLTGIDD